MEVLVERRGRVGLVTMNRPEKLNALNTALTTQLESALRELDADDEIGAIVVTGAG
jgi:enoyl-CoA hydratase